MADTSDFGNSNGGSGGQSKSWFSGDLGPLDTPWNRLMNQLTPSTLTSDLESPSAASVNETAYTLDLLSIADDPTRMLPSVTSDDPAQSGEAEGAQPSNEDAVQDAADVADTVGDERRQESARKSAGPRAFRIDEEYSSLGLRQRRAEDERMTGRHWPSNGVVYPGSPHEAQFFDQLAIAFGEADPRTLACEAALRYVRSSRVPGDDELAPTDIYAIVYYGLGLTVRPLDCTGLPQALALYHRATHDVYIDWKLLQDPPYGRVTLDPSAWRRSVDGSAPARFLLAWCAAVHLTDNYDLPLMLGFTPHQGGVPSTPEGRGSSVPPDTLNRYRKAITAVATLLAPEDRLWRQIAAIGLPLRPSETPWRDRLRAAYGYVPGHASQSQPDPVAQLISMLAVRNNCPPILIEEQLGPSERLLDWGNWSVRLLHEISELQLRFASAARMFHLAAAAGERDSSQGAPEVRPIHIQLSL